MIRSLQKIGRRLLGVEAARPAAALDARDVLSGPVRRWDSNDTDRLNQAHWSKASGLPINAELAYALSNLRARTEYEVSTNPIVRGMINTYCVDVVGPEGPSYRVSSSDPDYNRRRERVWKRWQRHAGANRQLSLVEILNSWVRALWVAGEFGTQMITVQNAPGPVKMRLLPVHVHRLLTPPEMLGDPEVALGVRRDDNRNPTQYYISEPYIFGPYEVYTGAFKTVPYADFIHGYLLEEEDQVRGVPWLAVSLDSIAQLRDWDKDMLDAAEAMARTGILWQLKNPDSVPTVFKGSPRLERGQQTFGPPGYEAEQLTPTQPSSDQQAFRKTKKAEIGRPANMPGMIVDLDSSGHNLSSARFDNQPYWRSVGTTQGWLGRTALDRIEYTVMHEAELAGELEEAPDDVETSWGWIKPAHIDQVKEAMAERIRMQNGTLPWSDAVIANGDDPDRILERLQRDKQRLADAGQPPIPGIPDPNKTGNPPPTRGKAPNGNATPPSGRLYGGRLGKRKLARLNGHSHAAASANGHAVS